MDDGERARLEQELAALTRRLSELEARLADVEGRTAAPAGVPTLDPWGRPWPPVDQWGRPWPVQAPWGAPQRGWPRMQASPPPQGRPPQPGPIQAPTPASQAQNAPTPQRPGPAPDPRPAPPAEPVHPMSTPHYADASTQAGYRPAQAQGPRPRADASARPAPAWPAPAASRSGEPSLSLASLRDLESRMTGRLLAWVGAAAVVLGAVFFLSLAFSRGWIGPEGRVALGLAGGAAFVGLGAWLFERRQAQLGHVMVAVGLGVLSLSLFAGTRFYGIYPPEVALAGSFVAAVVSAGIAVRVKSEAVAIYGLLAIAAAPPIMGAGASSITIAFLAITIVGTTGISLAKSWRWLPPIAFALTAPQLIYWLSAKPDAAMAVVALAAYWLLHAVAAAADELRSRTDARLEEEAARSAMLFFLNSSLAVGGGLWILSGDLAAWQGAYVAAAALAHFAFGAHFVWKRGHLYPFGVFINAIAVAAVALAIERQFDGPPVAMGWAIEAAVLTAAFGLRRNVYAGWAAAIIGSMAVAHLGVYEYPLLSWSLAGRTGPGYFAFDDAAGLTLAVMLAAGLVAAWFSRRTDIRIAILLVGSLVVAYSLPFELSGPSLVAPLAFEAALLVGVWRLHHDDYLGAVAGIIGALALAHLGLFDYATIDWSLQGATGSGPFPFADSAGLTLASLLAAGVVAGLLSRNREVRIGLVVVGSLLVAYALPYELSGTALVVAWAAEGVALVTIWGRVSNRYIATAAAVAGALALAHFGQYEYPWYHWTLQGVTGPGVFAFDDAAGLALAVLLVAGAAAGVVSRSHDVRCGLTSAGLLLIAYALSFEVTGVALMGAWAVLLPASIAAEGLLDLLPGVPESRARLRRVPVIELTEVHWPDSPLLPAAAAVVLSLTHVLVFEMPVAATGSIVVPATPFTDLATVSAGIGIASFLLAAIITARPDLRVSTIVVAAGLAAYTMLFEMALPFAVVAWCGLAAILGVWSFRPSYSRMTYVSAAAVLVAAGVVAILAQIVPLDRLGVRAAVPLSGEWFALNATVAIGATVLAVAAGAMYLPLDRNARSSLYLATGVGLVYLATVLLVNVFQVRVGGATALEELQKQAQVSVSILWALIGMGVFLGGLIGWRQGIREAGLGLLAIATGKVFLFDLSYLDVAYRVLSLIGLGLLLLVGAFAYQSLRPRRPEAGDPPAGGEVVP